jgi:hypothetical protein
MSVQAILDPMLRIAEYTDARTMMKCQICCNETARSAFGACGEQATMLWLTPDFKLPVPCCVYHAQACPEGEIVSLARPDNARGGTFMQCEAHA